MPKPCFNTRYCWLALGLLLTEVLIALLAHDRVIRPYGGDFLATIFVYCLLRSVGRVQVAAAAAAALLLSYLIEGLQYLDVLSRLGWQHSRVLRVVLGSHFAWGDMLAYTLGAGAVLAAEWGWKPDRLTLVR
ncbi:DUF2809 domain-containing protein [Hymenobacter agri]